jgi:FixJ family two-component response regulator
VSPPSPIVFVVDDDSSVREALSSLIRSVGLNVAAFVSAQAFLNHERPDTAACLVLDVRLPGLSGLDLQRNLAGTDGAIPIIFITGHADVPTTVRAMKGGAAEFLSKPFSDQELLDAIQQALERDKSARQRRLELRADRARYAKLTGRERQVMARVVRGLLNKQAAAELGISEITIKVHRHQVMHKMEAKSVPALVRMAGKLNLD